jgi:hypothetical protein
MRSRALGLATVTILAGAIGMGAAGAENLEAGKPPAKIFADTCSACHRGARGLLKTVPASSLPGFLRQHYTTSSDMASALSAYLLGNGASDHVAENPRGKKESKQEGAKEGASAATGQGTTQSGEAPQGRRGRQAARSDGDAKPGEDVPTDGRGRSDKLGLKQKRGKKGIAEEPPKDQSRPGDALAPKTDTAKIDAAKPEGAKPEEAKSESAKSESAKSESAKSESAKPETGKTEGPESSKTEAAKADAGKAEEAKPDVKASTASTEPAKAAAGDGDSGTPSATKTEATPGMLQGDNRPKEAALPTPPAAPTSNPRPAQRPMLTLPGFPPPVADTPNNTTPAAVPASAPSNGAAPAAPPQAAPPSAAPASGVDPEKPEPQKASSAEPPRSESPPPAEPAKVAEPAKPNAAKSAADQAAESTAGSDKSDVPKLDIIQEESHGPSSAPSKDAKRKKRTSER